MLPTLLTLFSLVGSPATADVPAERVLPFVADDYPRALAEARGRGVPLFVEAWAPW
jgi:hypothetical protein